MMHVTMQYDEETGLSPVVRFRVFRVIQTSVRRTVQELGVVFKIADNHWVAESTAGPSVDGIFTSHKAAGEALAAAKDGGRS